MSVPEILERARASTDNNQHIDDDDDDDEQDGTSITDIHMPVVPLDPAELSGVDASFNGSEGGDPDEKRVHTLAKAGSGPRQGYYCDLCEDDFTTQEDWIGRDWDSPARLKRHREGAYHKPAKRMERLAARWGSRRSSETSNSTICCHLCGDLEAVNEEERFGVHDWRTIQKLVQHILVMHEASLSFEERDTLTMQIVPRNQSQKKVL
ncbi:hypothetical protein GLOTRDRAFT_124078 [Gloeophyllum trabeum ATCC 11539]|uniref:Uncharacterized protein n=1 Tax=Gloeophyllum trabeum (strain ATCC 11539 / FP-39264 / Madison 617) TaxID=670483 RepID=S7QLN4_GLOTA|nr:uncharacterized protein GLOTRDRAFT_124078 [Gloeophyllum trabeum ATCC 11539]EPQ60322.1 hypothetical protein GLOTRDRAFT_124078 [Gloeophyllum trabeum ATCC 11539]